MVEVTDLDIYESSKHVEEYIKKIFTAMYVDNPSLNDVTQALSVWFPCYSYVLSVYNNVRRTYSFTSEKAKREYARMQREVFLNSAKAPTEMQMGILVAEKFDHAYLDLKRSEIHLKEEEASLKLQLESLRIFQKTLESLAYSLRGEAV